MTIADWLDRLGMSRYAAAFAENDIDFDVLARLADADLKELGVRSLGHRKRLLDAIGRIGAGGPASSASGEAQGERRPVAVLFADLCGYTGLSQRLDAEDVHAMLQHYFAAVDRAIVTNGGTVDKHIGDSVMGVFGAPVAHRDDALRAARATRDILAAMTGISDKVGFAVETHVGLAFGQVVASDTGSADHAAYTVTGEPVNLAARLTDLAAPGTACLSDDFAREVTEEVVLEALGPKNLKGVAAPVEVWRFVDLREGRERGGPPLAGRDAELAAARAAIEASIRDLRPVHIHLRGDPGIGKSRLSEEIGRVAAAMGSAAHVAGFVDFGGERTSGVLARLAAVLLADVPEELRASIVDPSRRDGAADESLDALSAEVLRDMLGLDIGASGRARRQALGAAALAEARAGALAMLMAQAARATPQCVRIEDAHWADAGQLDILWRAFRRLGPAPFALVTTSRIKSDPFAGPDALTGPHATLTLELQPLAEAALLFLARAWAADAAGWAGSLIARSGGNPLFLERLLRHRAGAVGGGLPESIQGLVLAEVDQLDAADKALVQAAAVLGQSFSAECLAHVIERDAPDLQGLARQRLLTLSDGGWRFSHALVRDAVYGSLLSHARRRRHLRASDWYAGRDATLRAQHLVLAEDARAGEALLAAAREALARHDIAHAHALATTARDAECTRSRRLDLAAIEAQALLDLGRTDAAVAAFEATMERATTAPERARLALGLAGALRVADRIDRALALIDAAQPVLEAENDAPALSALWHLRGNLHFPRGRLAECQEAHEAAHALAVRADCAGHQARALGGLGDAAYAQGRIRTARRRFEECVAAARRAGLPAVEAANANMAALCRAFTGPLDGVIEAAWAAVETASQIRHARAEIIARHAVMCTLLWSGAPERVRPVFERAQAMALEIGAKRFAAENLAFLGESERLMGRPDRARPLLEEALGLCRDTGMSFIGPAVLGYLAAAAVDEPAVRGAALDEGDSLMAGGGIAHNHLLFGAAALETCLLSGDWARAEGYADFIDRAFAVEPMPFARFLAARGRVLARHRAAGAARDRGEKDRSEEDRDDLARIAREGRRLGCLGFLSDAEFAGA